MQNVQIEQRRKTLEKVYRESTAEDKYTRFVKFIFKDETQEPIYLIFEHSLDFEMFIQKIKLICVTKWER